MDISDTSHVERLYQRYDELSEQIQFIEKETMPLRKERDEVITQLQQIYSVDPIENPGHDYVLRKVIFESGQKRLRNLPPLFEIKTKTKEQTK